MGFSWFVSSHNHAEAEFELRSLHLPVSATALPAMPAIERSGQLTWPMGQLDPALTLGVGLDAIQPREGMRPGLQPSRVREARPLAWRLVLRIILSARVLRQTGIEGAVHGLVGAVPQPSASTRS